MQGVGDAVGFGVEVASGKSVGDHDGEGDAGPSPLCPDETGEKIGAAEV